MFSPESYVTPYIASYLGKYMEKFNETSFKLSLWGGGVTFHNVDLNLNVIEAELGLPLKLSSGHIQELKITVPWTKITSEPILVNINTIEIGLRLATDADEVPQVPVPPAPTLYLSSPKISTDLNSGAEGRSPVESLMNRIISNAKFVFQNVIVKYEEKDFVISANIKTVIVSPVNEKWIPAFVDIVAPDFILRQQLMCSEFTVCLDRRLPNGKIMYLEPLLNRCNFVIRTLSQYPRTYTKVAHYKRADVRFDHLEFSITDDQVPLVARLRELMNEILSLTSGPRRDTFQDPNITPSTVIPTTSSSNLFNTDTSVELFVSTDTGTQTIPSPGDKNSGFLLDWASWAMNWVVGTDRDCSTSPEFGTPVLHLGLLIDTAIISIKTERSTGTSTLSSSCDNAKSTTGSSSSSASSAKSRSTCQVPYLKVFVQGLAADLVIRDHDSTIKAGISKVSVKSLGDCPCGKFIEVSSCASRPMEYLAFGRPSPVFDKNTLFDPNLITERSSGDYHFNLDAREEKLSDETMLEKTPGLFVEFVKELVAPRINESVQTDNEIRDYEITNPPTAIGSSQASLESFVQPKRATVRILIAPVRFRVSKGFVHRLKILLRAMRSQEYSPYSYMSKLDSNTCMFYKFRMDHLQIILLDDMTCDGMDAHNQIVLEIFDTKLKHDLQSVFSKWEFSTKSINIRSFHREGNCSSDDWGLGDCLGIILSPNNEIQPDIKIAGSSRSADESTTPDDSASRSSTPVPIQKIDYPSSFSRPESSNRLRQDSQIFFTYTIVETSNFHQKADVTSPTVLWNETLDKHGKDVELKAPPDQEKHSSISEVDMKIKPVDIVISRPVIETFMSLFKEIETIGIVRKGCKNRSAPAYTGMGNVASIPSFNNNTAPLIFLEAGQIRLFFKTPSIEDSMNVIVAQIISTVISCQYENPLSRNIIRTDLYGLAEEANINNTPGSLIEDRQYQCELIGVSVFATSWQDIEENSNRLRIMKSNEDMVSMSQKSNYIFESNPSVEAYPVLGLPIVHRFNINSIFSPAIVFQRHPVELFKSILVCGHSIEVNFSPDIQIEFSIRQFHVLQAVAIDFATLDQTLNLQTYFVPSSLRKFSPCSTCLPPIMEAHGFDTESVFSVSISESSSAREVDSGVGSYTTTYLGCGGVGDGEEENLISSSPWDVFIAGPLITLKLYNLVYEAKNNTYKTMEESLSSIRGIVPLFYFSFGQPYFVMSTSIVNQRVECSAFDLNILLGDGGTKIVQEFASLPKSDFPLKLYESKQGERDFKTGMITPFLTLKTTDQSHWTCDLAWPVKFDLSEDRLSKYNAICVASCEEFCVLCPSTEETAEVNDTENPGYFHGSYYGPGEDKKPTPLRDFVNSISHYFDTITITSNQTVLVVTEEPPGLPKASITISISSTSSTIEPVETHLAIVDTIRADRARFGFTVNSLVITTVIGDRSAVFMNPWTFRFNGTCEWHDWLSVPITTASLTCEPLSIYFGPQNVLAFLQVYHTFGEYLRRFIAAEGAEILQILEASPLNFAVTHYKDDLRVGPFKYVFSESAAELPDTYQIAISSADRTLTWKYPNQRIVTEINAIPIPIFTSEPPAAEPFDSNVAIKCHIEYWDEAKSIFLHYGEFYVSEQISGNAKLPKEEQQLECAASIWRIRIISSMNDDELSNIFEPDILASSIEVNSMFSIGTVPKLRFCFDIPTISLHISNDLGYSGKIPEPKLSKYKFSANLPSEQIFANLEFSMFEVEVRMWAQRAQLSLGSYFKLTLLDYLFLTDIEIIEAFHFGVKLTLYEDIARKVFLCTDILTKPIQLKIGGSTLHTLVSSVLNWMQCLKAYYGDQVDPSINHFQKQIYMSPVILCNDTAIDIGILQVDTDEVHVLAARHCMDFHWHSQKAVPECLIGIREGDDLIWNYSNSIRFHIGPCVDVIGKKIVPINQNIFITTEKAHTAQVIITISGGFIVANALDQPIEVGLLLSNRSTETAWTIESRSHGPSQLINIEQVEHLRFRYASIGSGTNKVWSNIVTVKEIRDCRNSALCLGMYMDENGVLNSYNVWCSLVEETIHDCSRSLIIISPFFRIRSALAFSSRVNIQTSQKDADLSFNIPGCGSEVEIQYIGNRDAVHHLTFQKGISAPASSPTIPLIPAGPALENTIVKRPIVDILYDIESPIRNSMPKHKEPSENTWPYIGEFLELQKPLVENVMDEADTHVNVSFSPWISGLPSVLVDAKPWALFINLTGGPIYFAEFKGRVLNCISSGSAFTPISVMGQFSIGVQICGQEILWSKELELTDEQSPYDIHCINTTNRVPIDATSRLLINGPQCQCYFTFQLKYHNGILLIVLRPTFYIQNKTKLAFSVKGICLHDSSTPSDDALELEERIIELKPITSDEMSPLINFTCDWDTLDPENFRKAGLKYLGVQYGSAPWWMIVLNEYEQFFDNLSAPQGVPVSRHAISIPNCQPHWTEGPEESSNSPDLPEVTVPISVSWVCKKGQVWISITEDSQPQLVLENNTPFHLLFSEIDDKTGRQVRETPHFYEFRSLPPRTRGFYTFIAPQEHFPDISLTENKFPQLVLGVYPDDLNEAYATVKRLTLITRDVNEIIWSNQIRIPCGDPVQLIHLGRGSELRHLKIVVEKLGHTHYVYIDEMLPIEIPASDVRSRLLRQSKLSNETIMSPISIESQSETNSGTTIALCPKETSSISNIFSQDVRTSGSEDGKIKLIKNTFTQDEVVFGFPSDQLAVERQESYIKLLESRRGICGRRSHGVLGFGTCSHPYYEWHWIFPQIRFIITDDYSQAFQRKELLSLTIVELFVRRTPKPSEVMLRCLSYSNPEKWSVDISVGDMQIDNSLHQDKRCDFPVLFKRVHLYSGILPNWTHSINDNRYLFADLNFEDIHFLLRLSGEYDYITRTAHQLVDVAVSCESFLVNIENQFVEFVKPLMLKLKAIVLERLPQIREEAELIEKHRRELPKLQKKDEEKQLLDGLEYKSILALMSPRNFDETGSVVSISSSIQPSFSINLGSAENVNENDDIDSLHGFVNNENYHYDLTEFEIPVQKSSVHGEWIIAASEQQSEDMIISKLKTSTFAISVPDAENQESVKIVNQSSSSLLDISMESSLRLPIPVDVLSVLNDLSTPIRLNSLKIRQLSAYVTMRMLILKVYFSVDNSPLSFAEFKQDSLVTTTFTLGQRLAAHYLTGAFFTTGNSARLLGSVELLGSPGTLARNLGSGVRDFVMYPAWGIRDGPIGFASGLTHGFKSLASHISGGTLSSVTNWAWSVSRNIDRITMNEEEQVMCEESRRIPIDSLSDGLRNGLTGFGIRLLGAISGVTRYPREVVMENGLDALGILAGVGKGFLGVVTRPVGATVELVAMTGQGILKGSGWTPTQKRLFDVFIDQYSELPNSQLKYRWKLGFLEGKIGKERILFLAEAAQRCMNSETEMIPVSLVITTENVYVLDYYTNRIKTKESLEKNSVTESSYSMGPHNELEFVTVLSLAVRSREGKIFEPF